MTVVSSHQSVAIYSKSRCGTFCEIGFGVEPIFATCGMPSGALHLGAPFVIPGQK